MKNPIFGPAVRTRRLRRNASVRRQFAETTVQAFLEKRKPDITNFQ